MKILAIDLGKFKSVACRYVTETGKPNGYSLSIGTASGQAEDEWITTDNNVRRVPENGRSDLPKLREYC